MVYVKKFMGSMSIPSAPPPHHAPPTLPSLSLTFCLLFTFRKISAGAAEILLHSTVWYIFYNLKSRFELFTKQHG